MSFGKICLVLLSISTLGESWKWDTLSQQDLLALSMATTGHPDKRDSVPSEYVAAPYYPTPKGGWVSNWTAAYAKAEAVVSSMTLAEKVNLTSGTGLLMVSFLTAPLPYV